MDMTIEPGTYVVAVSGGVDSMALLDMMRQRPDLRLVVAHLDHGIRADSAEDRRLVQAYAAEHGLPFVYHALELGERASEAAARAARYEFLHKVREATGARAVVTAHHQDDVLETAVHNIFRGTGRKGLSSLGAGEYLIRPLLHASKADLKKYALANGLKWREDSTNTNLAYKRNYIRHKVLPRLSKSQRQELHGYIKKTRQLNYEIDSLLEEYLRRQPAADRLDRKWFIGLPHGMAREMLAAWLRANGVGKFDRKLLERLVTAAKTLRVGKFMSLDSRHSLSITANELALVSRDR